MIRELQEEVAKLQLQLAQHTQRMPTPPATSEHGGTGKTGADHREGACVCACVCGLVLGESKGWDREEAADYEGGAEEHPMCVHVVL